MYLSCADEEINRRQKSLYEFNKKIIDKYESLPFYKKMFTVSPNEQVTNSWINFRIWMDKRIEIKKKEDSYVNP